MGLSETGKLNLLLGLRRGQKNPVFTQRNNVAIQYEYGRASFERGAKIQSCDETRDGKQSGRFASIFVAMASSYP
jgi:hypothetical protein